jgi:hypothetical protein
MSERDAQILAQALETMERDDGTLDEYLEQYPELKDELTGLIDTVQLCQSYPIPAPSASFRSAARSRILSHAIDQEVVTFWTWLRGILQNTILSCKKKPALAIIFIATLILSLIGSGTVYASQASLPGDRLYPVKLTVEDGLLGLSSDARSAELSLQYAGERVEELKELIEQRRFEDIPISMQRYQVQVAGADQDAVSNHVEVLTGLLDVVPEEARTAIEQAITASVQQSDRQPEEEPGVGRPDELPSEIPANLPPDAPIILPTAIPENLPPVIIPSVPPVDPSVPPVGSPPVPRIDPPVPPGRPSPVPRIDPPVPPVEPLPIPVIEPPIEPSHDEHPIQTPPVEVEPPGTKAPFPTVPPGRPTFPHGRP